MRKVGGMEVHGTTSVRSAMDMMSGISFDVIVSDYQMPETDGIDFLKMVRARDSDIPFILFTGKGREDVAIEALNQGADFYLQKGGDLRSQFHELTSMISKGVEGRRSTSDLVESQERFRELADSISDLLVGLDDDFRVTFWNKTAEELLGVKSAEAIGMTPFDLVPVIKGTPVEDVLRSAARSRTMESVTTNLLSEDGARMFEVSAYPGVEGLLVFARDMTASETASRLLAESEEAFRALAENSPYAVIIGDGKGGQLYANRKLAELTGYSVDELLKLNAFEKLTRPEDVEAVEEQMRKRLEDGSPAEAPYERILLRKDGTEVITELTATTIMWKGEKRPLALIQDITERKKAEEGLRKVNKKLNLLGGITRHDSLNQLTILKGWLTTAIEQEGDDSVRDMLLKVEKAADSLKMHLDFTSRYKNLGMKRPAWMSLAEAVAKVTEGLGRQGISVNTEVEDIEVFADPMLENVFRNLVNNSIAHGGGDMDSISLSLEEGKDGLVIIYEDNGVGIPTDEKAKIFAAGHGKRHGYGLYLSWEVLSITDMRLKETGIPKKGARFEIFVPPGNYRRQSEAPVTP